MAAKKPRKWAFLRGKLEPLVPDYSDNPDKEALVNRRRSEIVSLGDHELASLMVDAKRTKDELEEKLKAVEVEIESLHGLIAERWEANGVDTLKLSDGSSVSTEPEPHSKVTEPEKFIPWIKANGYEGLLTVQWQTMNAMVKARLEADQPAPPGVEVNIKTKVIVRGR